MGGGERQVERRPPIIQYWHEEDVPASVAERLASFREANPDMRHLVFNESTAESFIEEYYSAREVAAFRTCAVPAMQADYLRYCAVGALGGICCDADCRCTSPLRPLVEVGGAELFRHPDGSVANGFLVFGSPEHPLPRLVVEVATANIEHRVDGGVAFVTGPRVVRTLVESRRFGSFERWLAIASKRQYPAPCHLADGGPTHPHMKVLCAIIDQDARLVEAFEGVRVSSLTKLNGLIRHDDRRSPPYKGTALHYPNFEASIYREG